MSRLCWLVLLLLPALPASAAPGWEDGFEGKALDARWQWRVPVKGPTFSLSERPGWLRIRLPERQEGFNHWNEPKPVDEAPQLRAPAPEGDWELEARLQLLQVDAANHFQAGLVAGVNDGLLLTLGPLQGPSLPGGPKSPEAWLEPTGMSGFFRVPGDARDVHLQMIRTGSILRARIRRGNGDWSEAGTCLLPQAPRFVGIIGKSFSPGPPVVFEVDTIRLAPVPGPTPAGRRALVGVGGEYPTGYAGMLARLGLPYETLLDHQLAHPEILRRFDLLLVGGVSAGTEARTCEAVARYVREGGTAVVDFRRYPPGGVPGIGRGGNVEKLPDIVVGGAANPLAPPMGEKTRLPRGESRSFFEPASLSGIQVLARYDGQVQASGQHRPAPNYTGTPAVWAVPMGAGLLVYSSAALGASLSWGPTLDPLAGALIQCLGKGRLEPQLVPEGARFGRKQSGLTAQDGENAEAAGTAAPAVQEFARRTLAAGRDPLPKGAVELEEAPAAEFNLSGVYHPRQGRAELLLNTWSRRFLVGVTFEGTRARLARIENGRSVDGAVIPLANAQSVPFLVKERRDRVLLLVGEHQVSVRADGLWEGRLAAAGAALEDVRYQPVEPALLNDDFARGDGEEAGWEPAGGKWSVRAVGDPRMGANPFTYSAQAQDAGLSATGWPFWDDYAFDVAVRPTAGGTVGQAFYYQDEKNHLLFRARVAETPLVAKDGLEIVRVEDGKERVLARRDGCLVKGHWYRLSVQVREGAVTAAVDGEAVGAAEEKVLPGGRIALYVRDGHAEFDDVAVRPAGEALPPVELDGAVPRFAGTLDRDTWAGTALQWRADAGVPGLFWRRGRLYGDFELTFRCALADAGGAAAGKGAEPSAAAMTLLLAPETGGPEKGCRLTIRPTRAGTLTSDGAAKRTFTVELEGPGAPGRCTVTAGEQPVLGLRRVGSRLQALVDGRQGLECAADRPAGELCRLGFLATGFRPRLSGLSLEAGSVLDTCFDRAPTDWWVASGTWELAARWPCTPEWSWFAGESRQVAAIWHKRLFTGDVTLDLHVGPRTVDHGDGNAREICRAFNATLCGDGRDARSGYSFVVGAGRNGSGAALSRGGQVVARNPDFAFYSDAHNQWINVRAEKLGARVSLWVGDQRVLSWEDPAPLPEGRLGIWTEDNSVMIPRATIFHREPPGKLCVPGLPW